MSVGSAQRNKEEYLLDAEEMVLNALEDRGITIIRSSNFTDYAQLLKDHLPDRKLGPPFDPEIHDLNENNGIWLAGFSKENELVHTQAVRLLSEDRVNVSDYFSDHFLKFPPPGVEIDQEKSWFKSGPGARRLNGRIAYHGEVWLQDNPEYRGSGVIDLTGRLVFCAASRHLRPDAFIGLMTSPLARKGLPERQGYMHSEPRVIEWWLKGRDKPIEVFMVHQTVDDVEFLLSHRV